MNISYFFFLRKISLELTFMPLFLYFICWMPTTAWRVKQCHVSTGIWNSELWATEVECAHLTTVPPGRPLSPRFESHLCHSKLCDLGQVTYPLILQFSLLQMGLMIRAPNSEGCIKGWLFCSMLGLVLAHKCSISICWLKKTLMPHRTVFFFHLLFLHSTWYKVMTITGTIYWLLAAWWELD